MSLQTWQETLITAQVDGTALASSTTATSLLPAAAKFTLPANFFSIGKALRVRAHGRISTVVTTPGTLTLDVRFGSTVVFNGAAMSLNTAGLSNVNWWLDLMLTCRAIGTSANLMGGGQWLSLASINVAGATTGPGPGGCLLPFNTAPAVGNNFDSTTAQQVDLFGTWSVANASNSIQVHQYLLESIN